MNTYQKIICYERYGIIKQLTQTYTPHQNGVVEHKNRIPIEMILLDDISS